MKNLHLILALVLVSCQPQTAQWETLKLDNNLSEWHIYQDSGSKNGWRVENDVLIFDKLSGLESGEEDASLLSNKQYTSFEITFDWKIEKGGNSGFMWGVREDSLYKYPYQTGPEIQIIDTQAYDVPEEIQGGEIEYNNIVSDLAQKKHYLGALYGLFPPNNQIKPKTAGEWNNYHIKIDQESNKGWVKLNNILINEFPLEGELWDERVSMSKFSKAEEYPDLGERRWYDFGKFKTGHICFQDHPGKAYYKNIKIKETN